MLRGELIPRQVTITWMGNRDPTHIGKFSNARIVPGPAVVVKPWSKALPTSVEGTPSIATLFIVPRLPLAVNVAVRPNASDVAVNTTPGSSCTAASAAPIAPAMSAARK